MTECEICFSSFTGYSKLRQLRYFLPNDPTWKYALRIEFFRQFFEAFHLMLAGFYHLWDLWTKLTSLRLQWSYISVLVRWMNLICVSMKVRAAQTAENILFMTYICLLVNRGRISYYSSIHNTMLCKQEKRKLNLTSPFILKMKRGLISLNQKHDRFFLLQKQWQINRTKQCKNISVCVGGGVTSFTTVCSNSNMFEIRLVPGLVDWETIHDI